MSHIRFKIDQNGSLMWLKHVQQEGEISTGLKHTYYSANMYYPHPQVNERTESCHIKF